MDERKLKDLREEFNNLHKDFVNLEEMVHKFVDKPEQNPDQNVSNIMGAYDKFLKYYEKYLTLLNEAKKLEIIEKDFEEKYIEAGEWKDNYYFRGLQAEVKSLNLGTLAEQLRREGIQQGMQQGKLAGEQTVRINQLNYRFSSLRPDYENRIKNAGADDLLLWSKKILFAKNVDEVFEA